MTTRTACQLEISERNDKFEGWLPFWRLKNADHPDAAIIPVFLGSDLNHLDRSYCAANMEQAAISAISFARVHGFDGMVYGFRNLKKPNLIKVGESKDAWKRMRKSPWREELGFTRHADRQVDFVAICLNISSREVETALHGALAHLSVTIDWGREWFDADSIDLAKAIEKATDLNQEEIWIEHFAYSLRIYIDPHQVVDTALASSASSLPASFAKMGFPISIRRRDDEVEIMSYLWCAVRYGDSYPLAHFDFLAGEYSTYDAGLAAEMRSLEVSSEAMIPHVYTIDGEITAVDERQHIDSIELICHFPEKIEIDGRNNEWEVEGAVYEILFSELALIAEKFSISADGVKRLGSRAVG